MSISRSIINKIRFFLFGSFTKTAITTITTIAGIASFYPAVVVPVENIFIKKPMQVSVPGANAIQKSLNIAKMDSVKYKDPSTHHVFAVFYVRPCVTHGYEKDFSGFPGIFALVSASPFGPVHGHIFNPGACRFLGNVKSYENFKKSAKLMISTISCSFGYNKNYYYVKNNSGIGYVSAKNNPFSTRISLGMHGSCYSVDKYKTFIIHLRKS